MNLWDFQRCFCYCFGYLFLQSFTSTAMLWIWRLAALSLVLMAPTSALDPVINTTVLTPKDFTSYHLVSVHMTLTSDADVAQVRAKS